VVAAKPAADRGAEDAVAVGAPGAALDAKMQKQTILADDPAAACLTGLIEAWLAERLWLAGGSGERCWANYGRLRKIDLCVLSG